MISSKLYSPPSHLPRLTISLSSTKILTSVVRRLAGIPPTTRNSPAPTVYTFLRLSVVFREIYSTRGFRLVLCADVSDLKVEYAIKTLREHIGWAKMESLKGLDPPYEPLIISERRMIRTAYFDDTAGWSNVCFSSAL